MIVPMKKAAIIVEVPDAPDAVRKLRSLGILHVEHRNVPAGTDISSLKDDIAMLDKVISIISSPEIIGKSGAEGVRLLKDWRFTAKHIVDTFARIDHLSEYSRSLEARIAEWEIWGDFDPQAILSLQNKGIYIRLCKIPAKEIRDIPKGIVLKEIAVSKGTAYCALISKARIDVPYADEGLPKLSISEMKLRLTENNDIIQRLEQVLRQYGCYLRRYREIRKAFDSEFKFHEALRGMGQDGIISYITGYVPYDKEKAIIDTARSQRWGISVKDPSEDDIVPTLVKNPAWISLIQPVFKLLEIVPGYRELDISFWFLIFFSVFFGMLIGDAGIGLIFILLTAFSQARYGKKVRNHSVFYLFYMLSLCAIIWGILTGTIFGQAWLKPWIKPLMPALRDDRNVQQLCFLIGAVHLSIAHMWRAILKAPALEFLADVGWTVILWGGFFLARVLVLGEKFPLFGQWLFITGATLVVLFTSPGKNIFKSIGSGLGALALNLVNSFTDIVSYIRLFAVGLASVAVADAFNAMAMDIGFGTFLSGIVTALILVIGQMLNVVLGPMSVLVHGVRLNVLEFCSHVDVKWSGLRYDPLKER